MIIKRINIISFGKLSDFKAEFSDGVNIIEGKNESGKSTICGFIKFIFYGLSQDPTERENAISWGKSFCSGFIIVEDRDKPYRIEREAILIQPSDGKISVREKVAIFDETLGKQIHKNEVPGEVFFGLPRSVFESTAFIGQIDGSRSGGRELAETAENILFSADENINAKKALKKLDEARVYLYYKNRKGGKIYDLIKERETLSEKLLSAQKTSADIINLEGTVRTCGEARDAAKLKLSAVSEELSAYERYGIRKNYRKLVEEKRKSREASVEIESLMSVDRYASSGMTDEQFCALAEKEKNTLISLESDRKSAMQSISGIKKKISDMNAKLNNFRRMGADESRYSLIETATKARKENAVAKKIFFAFCVLSVVFSVITIIFAVSLRKFWFIPFIAAIAFWIVDFIEFIHMNKSRKRAEDIYDRFGCRSYTEFKELLSAAADDKVAISVMEKSESEAEDELANIEKQIEDRKERIRSMLMDFSFSVSDDLLFDIDNACAEARKSEEYLESVTRRKTDADERIKELASTLSAYSDEDVKCAAEEKFDEEKMASFDYQSKKKERDFLNASITAQTEKIHSHECELASLYAVQSKPAEIAQMISAIDKQINELTEKFDAYVLAMESIEAARNSLRNSVSPNIAKTAGGIMSKLSEGKYCKLFVDSDFGISYSDNGMTHEISSLSAGTSDIAYISLRIALVDMLCKDSLPPFIFDESFARLDDDRLLSVLSLIENAFGDNAQAIILSCHDREKNMASNIRKARFLSI